MPPATRQRAGSSWCLLSQFRLRLRLRLRLILDSDSDSDSSSDSDSDSDSSLFNVSLLVTVEGKNRPFSS
jgi:hypothetical protein